MLSLWAAFKGSKILEYIAAGGAIIVATFLAILGLEAKGKAEGKAESTAATLNIDSHIQEKADAASATSRAAGASSELSSGTF